MQGLSVAFTVLLFLVASLLAKQLNPQANPSMKQSTRAEPMVAAAVCHALNAAL